MPNWTAHVGGAYLIARPWGKNNLRFFLLGAVLPDLLARIETLVFYYLKADFFRSYPLEAFHTPLGTLLLSLLIALFTDKPKKICGLLFAGGMSHFFMDMLENKMANLGAYLFFPFSYRAFQFNLFPQIGPWLYMSWTAFCFILLYAVWEKKRNLIQLRFNTPWKRFFCSLAAVLILPYITAPGFNAHDQTLQLIENPAAFEGKTVGFHISEVVNEEPLVISERFHEFSVVTEQKFKTGEWISIEGVYKNGKIYPSRIQRELGVTIKSLLSLPALILFPFLWWDWRKLPFLKKKGKILT